MARQSSVEPRSPGGVDQRRIDKTKTTTATHRVAVSAAVDRAIDSSLPIRESSREGGIRVEDTLYGPRIVAFSGGPAISARRCHRARESNT